MYKLWLGGLAFVVFGLIPLALALSMERWFWRLPLIRSLEQRKNEWDAETIWFPSAATVLGEYRVQKHIGSKITVAHHLADVASDVKNRLMQAQIRTFIITVIGVLLIGFSQMSQPSREPQRANDVIAPPSTLQGHASPSLTANAAPRQVGKGGADAGPDDIMLQLLLNIFTTYTVPIGATAFIVEATALILGLMDQSRKYERLLEPERVRARMRRRVPA
jgi:hypothetical protein